MTNVTAYGQGIMYTDLAKYGQAIRTAGWDTIILAMLHPHTEDDTNHTESIYFGDIEILKNGTYCGNANWPRQLCELLTGESSSLFYLLAGIGGADVGDFGNIQQIYQNNNNSFEGTVLQQNFKTFHYTFPMITMLDMDVENTYDVPSFVAFCQMLIQIGFGITFCPYEYGCIDFWTGSLKALNRSNPGAVKWWNLQAYAGGEGNNPGQWAAAISKAIPGFNTTGFIHPGDCSRNLDTNNNTWQGDCPPGVQALFRSFKINNKVPPYLGGGFIWTIDQILNYPGEQNKHPDPHSCGNVGMKDYIQAITAVLG
ncbi:MAG TPA: hypothetical protein VJW20_21210 [Candidatus Angelobacter sp.]|nr:hypothetical protein [Candidatus Angelobacter sp.]